MDYLQHYNRLPSAFGAPAVAAIYKQTPDDFQVIEQGGFTPAEHGDHLALRIRKTNQSTTDIVACLCRSFAVGDVDIGYSGQKDKRAITEQWFTVHLPGLNVTPENEITSPTLPPGAEIIAQHKHDRKLRHGTHTGNHFVVWLREVSGSVDALRDHIECVRQQGFPNYFGEQRFGIGHRNMIKAETLFTQFNQKVRGRKQRISRTQRSMYLSAARSFLFNEILATRIRAGNWLTPQPNEKLMLHGSRSFFHYRNEPDVPARLQRHDIHTTAPLWGRDDANTDNCAEPIITNWEAKSLRDYPLLTEGLERAGMIASRRALRCVPKNLVCEQSGSNSIRLSFELPPGSFATALLKELTDAREGR